MSNKTRARFIVIEGIDGAGTTTQARRVAWRLRESGIDAINTFEPTDGPIGSLIRQVLRRRLVNPQGEDRFVPVDADTLTLLFSADRLDHLQNVVGPALANGRYVVCDRYYYSTIAYQGVDGDIDWIERVNAKALRPDLVIFLKIDPALSLRRIGGRADSEIFEKADFLEKVSANYDAQFENDPQVVTLDATREINDLTDEIMTLIASLDAGE